MLTSAGRPYRRSVRLNGFTYRGATYFVTICSFARRCIFGSIAGEDVVLNRLGTIVNEEWLKTPAIRPDVVLDEFVIMPNHMHSLVFIPETQSVDKRRRALAPLIAQFKDSVTRRARPEIARAIDFWQRNFFEHIVRDQRGLERARKYIRENPMRWAFDRENPAMWED